MNTEKRKSAAIIVWLIFLLAFIPIIGNAEEIDDQNISKEEFYIKDGVLIEYTGSDTKVTIPNGVKEIGDRAFKKCRNMEMVWIPEGVTKIGEEAFAYCSSLISVTIPNSVKEIGEWAFTECKKLESVVIGNSVETIGEWAFYYCTELKEIAMSNSVSLVGEFTFRYCHKDLKMYLLNNPYMVLYCKKYQIQWELASEETILVTGIQLNETSLSLKVGESFYLMASIEPLNVSNRAVIWKSSKRTVALVDKKGKVTAVGKGTATILCMSMDGSEVSTACVVSVGTTTFDTDTSTNTNRDQVSLPPKSVTGEAILFELSEDEITMEKGSTQILEYSVVPRQPVLLKSDNPEVASITEDGLITAKKAGVAVISAILEDGTTKNCLVKVVVKPSKIKLNQTKMTMEVGESFQLKVTFSPKGVSKDYRAVTWKSNNKKVVTVSKNGTVKAKAEGAVTITAITENGVKAVCKIVVLEP